MPLELVVPTGYSLVSNYEWGVDVDTNDSGTAVWQPLRLLTSMTPTPTQITRDEQVFENNGAPNLGVIGVGYSLASTSRLATAVASGLALPEYELLAAKSRLKGTANVAHVRWYHKPRTAGVVPQPVAFEAYVSVAQAPPTTGTNGDTSDVTYTLATKGEAVEIVNPYAGAGVAVDPVITSVTPTGRSVGEQVTILGANFTAAATITFDGVAVPADTITYVDTTRLVITIPAGAAGASDVIVTTTAGASNTVSYTVV